ncbi:MAG: hypothetical protein Q9171_003483 [Xanthocarpia ochracea]
MTASTYTSVHLAKRPKDVIIPNETFTLKTHDIPKAADLKDGEVLFQSLYLSLDPAMRGWMNDTRSYVPPVQLGETMRGACIGIIKASKSSSFPTGAYAIGTVGWTEYAIVPSKSLEKVEIPKNGKLTDALGVLGMTGLTAYFGILSVGQVKAGDFVVVSGAAGATGSVVGQIAKLKGATVLGIAGSDDKIQWLKESLGFDDALNYKDSDFPKKFKEATKQYIDVFFDNGNPFKASLLPATDMLKLAAKSSTLHWDEPNPMHASSSVAVLHSSHPFTVDQTKAPTAISQYNSSNPQGPKNYLNIISQRIRYASSTPNPCMSNPAISMEGFIVFDYAKHYSQARAELSQWLAEGKIQRKKTIVQGGLAKAGEALVDLYKGSNTGLDGMLIRSAGKMLVEVFPHPQTAKPNL